MAQSSRIPLCLSHSSLSSSVQLRFTQSIPRTIQSCPYRSVHSTKLRARQIRKSTLPRPISRAIKGTWATREHKLNRKYEKLAGERNLRTYAPLPWKEQKLVPKDEDGDGIEEDRRRRNKKKESKQKQNQSPAAQRKKALENTMESLREQRKDFGLSASTWVAATGANRRKLYKTLFSRNFMDALKYFGYQYYCSIANLASIMYQRSELFGGQFPIIQTANRRAADLATRYNKSELAELALDMHEEMYTAFADARIADIERICLEGLSEQMRQRISRRSRDEVLRWARVDKVKAKMVCWKQTPLPFTYQDQKIYSQQATIRIRSTQILLKGTKMAGKWTEEQEEAGENVVWQGAAAASATGDAAAAAAPEADADASAPPAPLIKRETTEYLVLQRRLLALEPTAWSIWGFTEETTIDNFREVAGQTDATKQLTGRLDGSEGEDDAAGGKEVAVSEDATTNIDASGRDAVSKDAVRKVEAPKRESRSGRRWWIPFIFFPF